MAKLFTDLDIKDKDTGKGYFKIPVPDEDTISKAVNAFGRKK